MQTRPLLATDINRFILVGDPQFSPDGEEIVFVRQESCADEDKLYSTLWLIDRDGANLRPLTHGKKNDRWPRWSPDGSQIAFLSGRSGKSKIWILNRRGGEAFQLATDINPTSGPSWSPDGKKIAFCGQAFSHDTDWTPYPGAPEDDYRRAQAQAENTLAADKDDKISKVKVISRLRHKMDGLGYYGDLNGHIFVVDMPQAPGAKPRHRQLTQGSFDHANPAWSADGSALYFSANRSPEADWQPKHDLWKVDIEGGQAQRLLTWTGYINQISPSPDGRWLAFGGDDKTYGGSTTANLWLVANALDQEAKRARCLTKDLDRPLGTSPSSDVRYGSNNLPFKWIDRHNIVFHYGNAGSSCIGQVDIEAGQSKVLWSDPMRAAAAFDCSPSGDLLLQIGSAHRSDDLYLLTGGQERQVTDFNSSLYAECLLVPARRLTYAGDQGWEIDGWLFKPPQAETEGAQPTVLIIHGGPHGVYGSSLMFQAQILASNGLTVFYANPRGSQSYGQEFAYAVVEDWGGRDFKDLMLGLDHLIEQGVADKDSLGIMGWSYGGYMTTWAITQTDRFKAALPGAIVGNLHSFYGSSDIGYYFGEHQAGGNPWDNPQKLLGRSAINYADKIKTPVLFLHGEGDLRCPIAQTDELFTALRRLKKPAVMVRYPGEYHAISRPNHKEDRHRRILSWFKHHLRH